MDILIVNSYWLVVKLIGEEYLDLVLIDIGLKGELMGIDIGRRCS